MFKQEIIFTVDTSDVRVSRKTSQRLQQWQTQMLHQLQWQPGKPKYPIRWTSERQRRAYFATKGFGRGIPTRRTGALSKGWDVNVDVDQVSRIEAYRAALVKFLADFTGKTTAPTPPPPAVLVEVSNPVDYEQYVTGLHQQGFHKDTGWHYTPDILDTAFVVVEGIVSDL